MNRSAEEIHEQAVFVDGHNHMMMEIYQKRYAGERAVFSNYYAPLARAGGVNVMMTNVGGDNFGLTDNTDLLLQGAISIMDMLWQEAEESKDTMAICQHSREINAALAEGKVAVLLTMEGARPLEGRPHRPSGAILRSFYRQGLRGLQLVDNGRNRLCDGKGESRSRGGLTNFGVSVVQEMNRLGMIVDVAHIAEPGFWDVMDICDGPVIDSHSDAAAVCEHPRNLKDEQIKAIAQKGGVVGLTFNGAMTGDGPNGAGVDDLIKHVDHIAELIGVDHVGFGPDLIAPHPGPPTESPGWLEGVYYGATVNKYVGGFKDLTGIPFITEALVNKGYSDEDIKKVLGKNFLRVYRQVIG
jgi:membrane dipeptidase